MQVVDIQGENNFIFLCTFYEGVVLLSQNEEQINIQNEQTGTHERLQGRHGLRGPSDPAFMPGTQ